MAFKFMLGHQLKTLLNDVEDKHKEDISDFVKGHLNESRILKAPLSLNPKSWDKLQQSRSKDPKFDCTSNNWTRGLYPVYRTKSSKRRKNLKLNALVNFAFGTSGVMPQISTESPAFQDVHYKLISASDERLTSPHSLYSQIDDGTLIEELPLQDLHIPTSPIFRSVEIDEKTPKTILVKQRLSEKADVSNKLKFFNQGITRIDQYKKMKSFEKVVLNRKEIFDQQALSRERVVRHHEQKLEKGLAAINSLDPDVHLHKLQVFSSVFDDIINESSLLHHNLYSIKHKYDSYITKLLGGQPSQQKWVNKQVIQLITSGTSQPSEMKFAVEHLVALETKMKSLLNLNLRLQEDLKSQQHNLNKTPEIPAKRTPPVGYKGKELPVELSLELENMKALILDKLDELEALHTQIREDFVPISVCSHLELCIKETEGEIQKLLKQNEYYERSIAEMEADLQNAITEADTSEKDARRIWLKVNSVRSVKGNQQNNINDEDYDEESKWNWYIS